ncbi:MAG: hypothetical protein LAQ30_19135 [Acidobacteriia bacterium]|nr:hypothetical protein [Terriglobia bacterium]
MRWLFAFLLLAPLPGAAGPAGDIARAIRENSLDRDECYRVRDLRLTVEDIRIYLTDGYLIFTKPVAGRRISAIFTTQTAGGEAEVLLMPPDIAERRSLARYIHSPNLDEQFQTAVLLFTGDVYQNLRSQMAANPYNRKAPEVAQQLDEEWTPVLQNLGGSYQTRLALDLLGGPARKGGLFAGLLASPQLGNIDVIFDPDSAEQILAGQVVTRNNIIYFDTWTSFEARSFRGKPAPRKQDAVLSDYRIEATVGADLSLSAVTRVKVKPAVDGLAAIPFDITPQMQITQATVDGRPAEVLQRDALRVNILRGGNALALVVPPEPLREGREYEFEFQHSGRVILNAGPRVYYVSARGNWYPMHGLQFASYDLLFRFPRDLDLVTPGEIVEDAIQGETRIVRRRTSAPIRLAGFNLGDYERAQASRGGYEVDVYANRTLENALQPKPVPPPAIPQRTPGAEPRRPAGISDPPLTAQPVPNPTARLQQLALDVASAMEFMASRFGPPALPHLTVSPIPATFGQGFPGLLYLSTLSYLKSLPPGRRATEEQEIFFEDVLQAHETAHQWWGNRVVPAAYRDYWLMEALANYSALLYLEKHKGQHAVEVMLDAYRDSLLEKNEGGETVESAGPIVLGTRLESSIEPRGWRNITYGKGSWILQMLRARMGDDRFLVMLAELARRYDHKEVTTEEFRGLAAQFLPPKTDDPALETFFDQWVYGTGIPTLKLTYAIKGKAPSLRLVGSLTQSGVEGDFGALAPVEIQLPRAKTVTEWVRAGKDPTQFSVALKQAPVKVLLDPHHAVLRKQ